MIAEDEAKRIAHEHFAQKFPAWPNIQIATVEQTDRLFRVSFYPENEAGKVLFFTRYTAEIDGDSGEVRDLR